ncbi:MAG TPA: L-rhamnose mutarotase [Paludibacter sp.]|jgi:L-rhamnose mutarotase|nr:L-rhamnose mutarotase [Paludibacter sp.]
MDELGKGRESGYKQKKYKFATKRYCQTLELKEDQKLIRRYLQCHSKAESWPEIRAGIRSVGILEMEIYIHENKLFMIVETPLDFEWKEAFARLATLPRQEEWEEYVAFFQKTVPNATSAEKWQLMERFFYLYE